MNPQLYSAWQLCRASLTLIQQRKSLLIYIITNNLSCLAILALFFAPIYHRELLAFQNNTFNWFTITAPIVTLLIYFLFHHFFHIYFYTALTAAVMHHFTNNDASLKTSFQVANRSIKRLLQWTWIVSTIGVPLRVIEGWFDGWYRLRWIRQYLAGQNWGIASYFVLPVLVEQQHTILNALQRSAEIMRQCWSKSANPNFHLSLVFVPLACIGLIPAAIGFYQGTYHAIAIGTTTSAAILLIISSLSSTIYSIIRVYAYQTITNQPVPKDTQELVAEFFNLQ